MAKDTFQFKKLTYNVDLPYDKIECPLLRSLHLDFTYDSGTSFETRGTNLYVANSYIREYTRKLIEFVQHKGILYKFKEMANSNLAMFEPV